MTSESSEIKSAISKLGELTVRIDERVKTLITNHGDLETTVEKISQSIVELTIIANDTRTLREEIKENQKEIKDALIAVSDLTHRVSNLENNHTYNKSKWQIFLNYAAKTLWAVTLMYILYKLNIPQSSFITE